MTSTSKQEEHLLRLCKQHGLDKKPDAWRALFETDCLSLLFRVAAKKPNVIRALKRSEFRRLLELPGEEFEVFCPLNIHGWEPLFRLLGVPKHPLAEWVGEQCQTEERGKFKRGELVPISGDTAIFFEKVTAMVRASLSQLLWFCDSHRLHMFHQADLVGNGNTYTVLSGVCYPTQKDSICGVCVDTSHQFTLVPVKMNRCLDLKSSRMDMLVFPQPEEVE